MKGKQTGEGKGKGTEIDSQDCWVLKLPRNADSNGRSSEEGQRMITFQGELLHRLYAEELRTGDDEAWS